MSTTKKDLVNYVNALNNVLCKKTKNYLVVTQAYDGYGVSLTGKKNINGNRKKGSLGTAQHQLSNGHGSAKSTIDKLSKDFSNGYLKEVIKRYERY